MTEVTIEQKKSTNQWEPIGDYCGDLPGIIERLETSATDGLSPDIATARLARDGFNAVADKGGVSALSVLIDQFRSSVVLLLVIAAAISYILQEYLQTSGIVAAIFINAGIGFASEYQARVSLEQLARLTGSTARIRRGRQEMEIPACELVRGDIVLLESGNRIPADLRIVQQASLAVDESILTGESTTVAKIESGLSDLTEESLLFQGTTVASGRAVGVVIKTGAYTRLGSLSTILNRIDVTQTPLEQNLDILGKQLTVLTIVCCTLLTAVGILQQRPLLHLLETSIALAVAAIPEGLPVVATLALAIGLKRMVDRKALVRRLPAVETLGCTTVICTDKTGTLTENRMLVTQLAIAGEVLQLSGSGYEPVGQLTRMDTSISAEYKLVHRLLLASALCNDAKLENHGDAENWHIHGDPTEGALLAAASKVGLDLLTLNSQYPRTGELGFDLLRKRMSTLHENKENKSILFCKGAPEVVIPLCTKLLVDDQPVELTDEQLQWFHTQNESMAANGLRVLAIVEKHIADVPACMTEESLETQMTLLGLVGMSDPVKPGVFEAITASKAAGIRVIMLTGDQPLTAFSIGKQLGICEQKDQLLSGLEIASMSTDQLKQRLKTATVLARVSPELKLSVVSALQEDGDTVAMTGDGVNDAPALKQADIGIATGRECSDLAREVSALVITDDNFSTITMAIEQGRAIYKKIKLAIAYMLTASLASLATTAIGVLLNEGLLLAPLQLLWLNLIMHVFPGLGIVLQRGKTGEMEHRPRAKSEKFLDNETIAQIFLRALLISAASLLAVQLLIDSSTTQDKASTIALTTLSLSLITQSWSWLGKLASKLKHSKSNINSWQTRFTNSAPMIVCTLIDLALLFAAVFFGPLRTILQTKMLTTAEWGTITLVSVATFIVSMILDKMTTGKESSPHIQITSRNQ